MEIVVKYFDSRNIGMVRRIVGIAVYDGIV